MSNESDMRKPELLNNSIFKNIIILNYSIFKNGQLCVLNIISHSAVVSCIASLLYCVMYPSKDFCDQKLIIEILVFRQFHQSFFLSNYIERNN